MTISLSSPLYRAVAMTSVLHIIFRVKESNLRKGDTARTLHPKVGSWKPPGQMGAGRRPEGADHSMS